MQQQRLIVSSGRAPEWLDVFASLSERLQWTPVYWITVSRTCELVAAKFPSAIAHDFVDLNRGIPANSDLDVHWRHLSATELHAYEHIECVAMEMMDRMDPDGGFSRLDRQRFYLWSISYWSDVLTKLSVTMAIFVRSSAQPR